MTLKARFLKLLYPKRAHGILNAITLQIKDAQVSAQYDQLRYKHLETTLKFTTAICVLNYAIKGIS